MTAISAVEIALWDLVGKACNQPVYRLLGGRCHDRLPAYANGWYGGARTPAEYAERAREAVARGYRGLKFDPFGTAWKELSREQSRGRRRDVVAAVREAVGPRVDLMIEFHGRLSAGRGDRDDPPARAVRSGLVRGAGRAREPRPAGRGRSARSGRRSRPASGSTPRPISTA